MERTLSLEHISTRQEKIARLARAAPETVLTTLAHHIDLELLLPMPRAKGNSRGNIFTAAVAKFADS
jgi:hypothetical protein